MSKDLRAAIIVDYQNVHLTGHNLFGATRNRPLHESLIDPLLFAQELLRVRNSLQKPGMAAATLRSVLVFRGQPSAEHDPKGYARSQSQKAHWERDRRVKVTLRPLKYEYERTANGIPVTDNNGKKIVTSPREKGVDVLCALEVVAQAADPTTELVIVASSDSDLAPALDAAIRAGTAKIETFCWWNEVEKRGYQLNPTGRSPRIWNTRLGEASLLATRDLTDHR